MSPCRTAGGVSRFRIVEWAILPDFAGRGKHSLRRTRGLAVISHEAENDREQRERAERQRPVHADETAAHADGDARKGTHAALRGAVEAKHPPPDTLRRVHLPERLRHGALGEVEETRD